MVYIYASSYPNHEYSYMCIYIYEQSRKQNIASSVLGTWLTKLFVQKLKFLVARPALPIQRCEAALHTVFEGNPQAALRRDINLGHFEVGAYPGYCKEYMVFTLANSNREYSSILNNIRISTCM